MANATSLGTVPNQLSALIKGSVTQTSPRHQILPVFCLRSDASAIWLPHQQS